MRRKKCYKLYQNKNKTWCFILPTGFPDGMQVDFKSKDKAKKWLLLAKSKDCPESLEFRCRRSFSILREIENRLRQRDKFEKIDRKEFGDRQYDKMYEFFEEVFK